MSGSRQLILMAGGSSVLSYALLWLAGNMPDWLPLPSDLFRYAPGFVFGALVLQLGATSLGRRLGLILACGLIWFLMFRLASQLVAQHDQSTLLACGLAGGLGAWLVSLVVRLLKPRRLSLLAMLIAFVTGTLGGCLIGQGLLESDESPWLDLLMISGFFVWQAGVGAAMLLVDELGMDEPHV